jgi:mRNA interferase RelE/StbE
MSYSIRILRRAQKALARLPKRDYERVRDAIRGLAENPRPRGARKLTDREGWRIRIGPYRVIYEIGDADRVVTVLDIGHRGDVYR